MVDSNTRNNKKLLFTTFLLVWENLKDIANMSDSIGSSKLMLRLFNFSKHKHDDFLAYRYSQRNELDYFLMTTEFFAKVNNGTAGSFICNKSMAVLKEYSLCRHHDTKHLLKYSNCPKWIISCVFGFAFFVL